MKKSIKIIFTALLVFVSTKSVFAYTFVDDEHSSSVKNYRTEIYDSYNMYLEFSGKDGKDEKGNSNNTDGNENVTENDGYNVLPSTNVSFWWPVGNDDISESNGVSYASSTPAVINITSPFGYRYLLGKSEYHSGIDISKDALTNKHNIIAAKSGVVVYPTKGAITNYNDKSMICIGLPSYGNYVMINHLDGTYTLYAHLYKNSIKVKAGDVVDQGQVIAKMGTSGCSTGVHLHFEIRVGENSRANAVNPLQYISADNPRP